MSALQTQLVKKTAIIDSGDFNLSAARYLDKVEINSDYDNVKLVDLCDIYQPKTISRKDLNLNGKYDVYGANGIIGKYDQYNHESSEILVGCRGSCGKVNISKPFSWITGNAMVFKINVEDKILKSFLYYMLKNLNWSSVISGSSQPQITRTNLLDLSIPLPPLEIQEQIVKEIEGYQQIIDGCRQVVENYKPVIDIDPSWDKVTLKSISTKIGDGIHGTPNYSSDGEYFFINGNNLRDGSIYFYEKTKKITFNEYDKNKRELNSNTILVSINGTLGNVALYKNEKILLGKSACYINLVSNINRDYIMMLLGSDYFKQYAYRVATGSTIKNVSLKSIRNFLIPIPNIETQKEIVKKLEQEREVIEGNKELIQIYEKKINDKIKELF